MAILGLVAAVCMLLGCTFTINVVSTKGNQSPVTEQLLAPKGNVETVETHSSENAL